MARTARNWRLRRRHKVALAGLLALLLVLVGQGLAWFGRGGGPAADGAVADGLAAMPVDAGTAPPPPGEVAPAPRWEPAGKLASPGLVLPEGLRGTLGQREVPGVGEPPVPSAAAAGMAGSAAGPVGLAGPAGPAAAAEDAGLAGEPVDPDRVQSLLSLLRLAIEEDRFQLAQQALVALRGLPAAVAGPDELAAQERALAAKLAAAAAALQQELGQGRVLAAEAALASMASADLAELVAALGPAVASSVLPTDLDATFAAVDEPMPSPQPLPLQRAVRWWREAQPVVGMVVDSRPLSASVRLVVGGAVSFPRLHLAEVEPLQPSAAEAVELALAARHAGRPRRARLWYLASWLLAGAAAEPARRAEVQRLLQ